MDYHDSTHLQDSLAKSQKHFLLKTVHSRMISTNANLLQQMKITFLCDICIKVFKNESLFVTNMFIFLIGYRIDGLVFI
jgi:hypothetical protein